MNQIENQKTENLSLFAKDLMTPEVVERVKTWITALRSGEYKQGRKRLFNSDQCSYCCLGVAKEVLSLHEDDLMYLTQSYKELGLVSYRGQFLGYNRYLDVLNDEGVWTFEEIAQLIEDQLNVVTGG